MFTVNINVLSEQWPDSGGGGGGGGGGGVKKKIS